MQIQTNIKDQHKKNNPRFKERPATSSLDQLVNPGSPPFIQSGAQQRVITGVPPVSTLIKTICSGGDNKKFLRFYHLVNPSIKTGPIIPWEEKCQNVKLDFFCQNGVSHEGDFFFVKWRYDFELCLFLTSQEMALDCHLPIPWCAGSGKRPSNREKRNLLLFYLLINFL